MAGRATSDRDDLLAFELALDEQVHDEVRAESWGRLFLTPSTPLIRDANWVGLERTGLTVDDVVGIADEALGGAGFAHRTVCVLDQADGRRLGEEVEAGPGRWPGWEVERTRYMTWRGEDLPAPSSPRRSTDDLERSEGPVREVELAAIRELRAALIGESMPRGVEDREATVAQLLKLDARYGRAGGDRWFVAPADGGPASACRLLRQGRVGQVEEVGTREHARNRGLSRAIVLTAVAASQAAGATTTFLTADAADWPQLLYARLGFAMVGDLTILRRRP